MRIKLTLCLAGLCSLVAIAILLRSVAKAPSCPSLIFSGFTNDGHVAVFTLTNSSRLYLADVWLADFSWGYAWPRPNILGDSQVKAVGGEWVDSSETKRHSGIKPRPAPNGTEIFAHTPYANYYPVGVYATKSVRIPRGGGMRVEIPVPDLATTVIIKNLEHKVVEHAPWRAGVRCSVKYDYPKAVESFLARFRKPDRLTLRYPEDTFKVWSAELPR